MSNSGNVVNSSPEQAGERRCSERHSFTAAADVMDPRTHLQISARTSDLDHRGCYIDTLNPFLAGTNIVLRIAKNKQSFKTMATVVYGHAGMGMGLSFDALAEDQLQILEQWLGKQSAEEQPMPQAATKHQALKPASAKQPVASDIAHAQSHLSERNNSKQPDRDDAAMAVAKENSEVLKYLVLMLIQKGVLVELEGQALLERLLN
jgi:hypothetical protein